MDRNAAFGAISIDARDDRRTRKTRAPASDEGTGINIKKTADGRCVNTIVRMRPMRLDSEDATSEDIAERMPMTKKMVPKEPSSSENFP